MDNLQEWIVPILTSIVAIAVAIMICKWQMRTELRKILESYVSDKKYKAYYDAVNIVFTLLEEGRQKYKFMSDAGIIYKNYKEVKQIVEYAADMMQISRRALDYSIWLYMSNKKRAVQLELCFD